MAAAAVTALAVGARQQQARSFGRESRDEDDDFEEDLTVARLDEDKYKEWRSMMGLPEAEEKVDEEAGVAPDPLNVKVTLGTKHFDITPALRDHVNERLDHVLERFGQHILSVDTHLEVLRNPRGKDEKHSAELVAAVRPGYGKKTVYVRVKATTHDMYLSINDMSHQIERKVRQLKERVTKGVKHRKDGSTAERLEEAERSAQTMTLDEELESFTG
jgi:putative sigma-54 modulation protein